MGMDGIIFVRPTLGANYAYNDSSTEFVREYTLLYNEIDTTPHDQLLAVQEFVWSDFKPNYWLINGRAYPDTLVKDSEISSGHELEYQPISSLVQVEENERTLS